MWKQLSYKKKNRLLLTSALFILVLSWFSVFQKTLDAVSLNWRLKDQIAGSGSLAESPAYTSERLGAINAAYDLFKADSADWRNELWNHVSNMASSDKYQLVYSSEEVKGAMKDSLILSQNILLKGEFKDLIRLLDSVENIREIGYISSLKLFKPERSSLQENSPFVSMEIQFRAVPRLYIH